MEHIEEHIIKELVQGLMSGKFKVLPFFDAPNERYDIYHKTSDVEKTDPAFILRHYGVISLTLQKMDTGSFFGISEEEYNLIKTLFTTNIRHI